MRRVSMSLVAGTGAGSHCVRSGARVGAESRRHAGADHPARTAQPRALHLDLGADRPGHRQGLRRPAGVRLRSQAQTCAGRILGHRARRQDRHLQAAQGREIPRRQAVHLRRRAVHHHGRAEEGASARHQHLPRRDRGRDAGRAYGGVQAQQRRAVHACRAVGLRKPDAAQARLQPGRHPHARQRQPADRHRPLQVRRMAPGRAGAARQEPRLLAQGTALSRPRRGALHQRRGDAHRRAREGRGACGRLRRRALQRRQEAGDPALDRSHHQGLRDDQPGGRAAS